MRSGWNGGDMEEAGRRGPWPGAERRHPSRRLKNYLLLKSLARRLESLARQELAGRRNLVGVDVGCGVKPYYPFFREYCSQFIGIDADPTNHHADRIGTAERLPLDDASVDVVVHAQCLEHVLQPAQSVREIRRVLRAGGVAFVSTHGVYPYHPTPADLWRWTEHGLKELLRREGPFADVHIYPCGGTVACLFNLATFYQFKLVSKGLGLDRIAGWSVVPLNVAGEILDAVAPRRLKTTEANGNVFSNFVAVARC